jgi:ribonuclease P protein component
MYLAHKKKLSINSIKSRKEFNIIYSGVKSISDTIVLFSSQLEPTQQSFAFVASKKVGSAVSRNRAKRRMRAALRIVLNSYNSRKPMQFLNNTGRLKENYVNQAVEHFCINGTILVARNTILTAAFEKIVKDLKYCIKKSEKLSQINV